MLFNDVLFICCTNHAEPDWTQFKQLFLGGCVDDDGATIGNIAREDAEFFTVYGRKPDGEAEAIADITDYDLAVQVLAHLGKLSGLETDEEC
jgi:hypothetical protein